jgi:predicted O-methyltransferase YrrM
MRFAPHSAVLYNSRTWARYEPYSFRQYVRNCHEYPDEYFDFVLVDGRARASCIRHAMRKLRRNGVLMLDNSERAPYQREMARLERLTRRDFFGNGPFADERWQTTIWFKDQR